MQKRIVHTCGHRETYELEGNPRQIRDERRKLERRLCKTCYIKRKQEQLAEVEAFEKEHDLALLHDYNQVHLSQSRELRSSIFRFLLQLEHDPNKDPLFKETWQFLAKISDAQWWYERKRFSNRHIYLEALSVVQRQVKHKRLEPKIKALTLSLSAVSLYGSSKQVRWAQVIRRKILLSVASLKLMLEDSLEHKDDWMGVFVDQYYQELEQIPEHLQKMLERMASIQSSVTWIQLRDKSPEQVAQWMNLDKEIVHCVHRLESEISFVLNL